ncbi:MAG: TerC family protein [Saprospiraceae bacterium]|nr:TerC family protein [Saprospiraceae bacterium]MBK9044641.1 TerC family protein [Saprospiraceae bacterium]
MLIWSLFILMIGVFLALDLGVFNKNAHEITYKEAGRWTAVWTTLGLSFSFLVYFIYQYNWLGEMAKTSLPLTASIEYLTGYIIELTLSIDNIFVIAMIFKSFKIPKKYQHRVLFWGIVGALLFRGLMIFFGVVLIEQFKWTTYVFGAFLIFTAIRMAFSNDEEEFDPKQSWVYRTIRRVMPVTGRIDGQKFIIKKRGLIIGTPLLLALILIEFTDILFALDSIPAILAITTDPFIVFTSNIFAILGLRSMYFFVANMLDSFHYLKYSLTVILIYVGIKLVLANHYHLPLGLSLGIIALSLIAGVYFSIRYKTEHAHDHDGVKHSHTK